MPVRLKPTPSGLPDDAGRGAGVAEDLGNPSALAGGDRVSTSDASDVGRGPHSRLSDE
jgi:hypothetical protein